MKRHHLRSLLLLAAVLFGQWLGIAHASQHEALEPESALCAYCISGIGGGGAPAATASLPLLSATTESPRPASSPLVIRPAAQLPHNRGPPQHS